MALPLTNRDKDLLLSALGLPEVRDRVVALLDLAGTGNMTGPASSTDNALVRFDGATGALVQNSGVLLDDSNNLSGLAALAISGQFQAANGTVGAPSYSFASDLDTGLFLAGSNETRMSNGGTATQIWQTANIFARVPLNAEDGSAGVPSYTFENDQNTGIYRLTTDVIGFSAGGVRQFSIDTQKIAFDGVIASRNNGSAGAPVYTFDNDQTTGIYLAGSAMRFSFGGTEVFQAEPGKLAMVGQFGAADGTVSVPGLSWDNDSNTGLYRIGADSVGIAAGGVRIANHSAAGNWGFGVGAQSGPTSDAIMTIGGTAIATASANALYISPTYPSTSTASMAGVVISPKTAVAAFNAGYYVGVFPQDVTLGAGSSITRSIMFYSDDPSSATNNAVLANNISFTGNYFINYNGSRASSIGGQVRVGSLGVGNSAAATTPGSVTRKIEVFSATGVSLGFVAVYDAIT